MQELEDFCLWKNIYMIWYSEDCRLNSTLDSFS